MRLGLFVSLVLIGCEFEGSCSFGISMTWMLFCITNKSEAHFLYTYIYRYFNFAHASYSLISFNQSFLITIPISDRITVTYEDSFPFTRTVVMDGLVTKMVPRKMTSK